MAVFVITLRTLHMEMNQDDNDRFLYDIQNEQQSSDVWLVVPLLCPILTNTVSDPSNMPTTATGSVAQ